MMSLLTWFSLILISFSSFAQEKVITFNYWSEAGPPFVILNDSNGSQVEGGLVKDLAELISARLHASPQLVNIPVQRTESQLISGAIDLNCITSPIWKQSPKEYYWSPVLFEGADRFLVKQSEKHNLVEFSDLKGKLLGVYNGYTYHPKIMEMLDRGDIEAVKVSNVDHGIKLLLLDRIDALIDFDIILEYKIRNNNFNALALADLYADRYELSCAYSKKSKIDKEELDKVFKEMVIQGEITKLLDRYQ